VAQVRALCERRVVKDLERKELESYCPFIERKRFYHGKKILFPRAMFPGYVFVKIKNCCYDVFTASCDVIRILTTSHDAPAKIDGDIIKNLKSLERGGLIPLPLPPLYHAGQNVKVKSGQFLGFHAIYEGPGSRHTEKVLIQLFDRWVPVHVDIDDLVAVG